MFIDTVEKAWKRCVMVTRSPAANTPPPPGGCTTTVAAPVVLSHRQEMKANRQVRMKDNEIEGVYLLYCCSTAFIVQT
jgi:hypothetical protein